VTHNASDASCRALVDRVLGGEILTGAAAAALSESLGLDEWVDWETVAMVRDIDLEDTWVWELHGDELVEDGSVLESRLDEILAGAEVTEPERETVFRRVQDTWIEDWERNEYYNLRVIADNDGREVVGVAWSRGGGWDFDHRVVAILATNEAARDWIGAQGHTLIDWAQT